MRRFAIASLAATALLLGGPATAQPAGGAIGLRVLVQPWNPLTDEDSVRMPVNDPVAISAGVARAWQESRQHLVDYVVGQLGRGDLIAPGVTLQDIRVSVGEPRLALQRVSGGGDQPVTMRVELRIPGVGIEATSTTPTPLGSWADPRCSAQADLTLSLGMVLDTSGAALLRIDRAASRQPLTLSNFSWDSQNFPCDVIKEAVGLFGAEGIIRRHVEDPDQVAFVAETMLALLEGAFGELNGLVASAAPPDLSRVAVWLDSVPGGQRLAVLFGVRGPVPDTGPRATISGTLRLAGVNPTGLNCAALPVTADRKAGPRPVLNANGTLGEAPLERLAVNAQCDAAALGRGRSVAYRVSGLSATFPNVLTFTGAAGRCAPGQVEKAGVMFVPQGWPEEGITAATLGARFDLQATAVMVPCPPEFTVDRQARLDREPVVKPLEELAGRGSNFGLDTSGGPVGPRLNLDTGGLATQRMGGGGAGTLQSLNPQPLPPREPDAGQQEQLRLMQEMIRLQQNQIRLQQDQLRFQLDQGRLR